MPFSVRPRAARTMLAALLTAIAVAGIAEVTSAPGDSVGAQTRAVAVRAAVPATDCGACGVGF